MNGNGTTNGALAGSAPQLRLVMQRPVRIAAIPDEEWLQGEPVPDPEAFVCDLRRQRRTADMFTFARALPQQLLPLLLVNFIESNPIPVKSAMASMGLLEEVYRLPMVPPRPASKQRIEGVLQALGVGGGVHA